MLRRCIFGLMLVCPPLFAQELTSFKAITQDLTVGKEIVVVANLHHCTIDNPNTFDFPRNTIRLKPPVAVFNASSLTFDGHKFVKGLPSLPENGIVEHISVNINAQGHMEGILVIADAESNKKISGLDDIKFQCELGDGVHVYQG